MFCLDSWNGGFNEALHFTNAKAVLKWGLIGYFHFLSTLCSQMHGYPRVHPFNLSKFYTNSSSVPDEYATKHTTPYQIFTYKISGLQIKSEACVSSSKCSALQKRILISWETPFLLPMKCNWNFNFSLPKSN